MRLITQVLLALGTTLIPTATALAVQPRADNEVRAVAASKYFDLTAPSADYFRSKVLQGDTVQQGFAFDNANGRLFVIQRTNDASDTSGDLTITELDYQGTKVGHMYLTGFGHGVAFGAQPSGTSTYLWSETDVGESGYGQMLGRFQYVNGKTLKNTSTSLTKFKPFPDATAITAVVNPLDDTLAVRYNQGGQHIAVFSLASAGAGDFSAPLANFAQPTIDGTFQGYAAYGQYLYVMTGTSYDESGGVLNSEVASIDLNTGKVHQGPLATKAGESLSFREPEGMGVYTTQAGEPRLFLGFASGEAGDRRSNLFYKNVLV